MIHIELTGKKFERLRHEFVMDDIDIIILAHISSTPEATIMQTVEALKPIASKNNTYARIKNLLDSGIVEIGKSTTEDLRFKKLKLTKKALKINTLLGE